MVRQESGWEKKGNKEVSSVHTHTDKNKKEIVPCKLASPHTLINLFFFFLFLPDLQIQEENQLERQTHQYLEKCNPFH